VNYAGAYGEPCLLPNGVCLEFAHAGDNAGPPALETIDELFAKLQEKYPGADIQAGSLDEFALAVREVREDLPLITEEIGDTWLHGTGSDPLKTAKYKELLCLKDFWLEGGQLRRESPEYKRFMENMLMIPEHTWGMNTKVWLQDYSNWKKDDFRSARAKDLVDIQGLSSWNRSMLNFWGHGEHLTYSHFEESHREQRAYIDAALAALPEKLRKEAEPRLKALEAEPQFTSSFSAGQTMVGVPLDKVEGLKLGAWEVSLGAFGEITSLKKQGRDGSPQGLRSWKDTSIGLFGYEVFDGGDVDRSLFDYARDMKRNWTWFEASFGSGGLRYEQGIDKGLYRARLEKAELVKAPDLTAYTLRLRLAAPALVTEQYGCPRDIVIEHCFLEDRLRSTLSLGRKDANRIPEALWFGFNFNVASPRRWRMVKFGREVDPLDVVKGGARRIHSVERLVYRAADGCISVTPCHAPLVNIGECDFYNCTDHYGDLAQGFNFNLFNNRWGVNFPLWFEDNVALTWETLIG
jgi:hypothetical protein